MVRKKPECLPRTDLLARTSLSSSSTPWRSLSSMLLRRISWLPRILTLTPAPGSWRLLFWKKLILGTVLPAVHCREEVLDKALPTGGQDHSAATVHCREEALDKLGRRYWTRLGRRYWTRLGRRYWTRLYPRWSGSLRCRSGLALTMAI